MSGITVIHGKFANNSFVPDEPLPPVEGRAELIVYSDRGEDARASEPSGTSRISIFDLFGKAPVLRSGEDIDAQLKEERDAWDDD